MTPPRDAHTYPIPYDADFLSQVRQLHGGAESLPGYEGWIRDHMGGRVLTFRERLIPNLQFFTKLVGQRVLDFGCGTGSSTVALAEKAVDCQLVASDVQKSSLDIAVQRMQRHEGLDAVQFCHIPFVERVGDLPFGSDSFDVVLANGVLEHVVPFATRPQVILEMWRVLAPGGVLYINETPNALWPIDRHTTGLPLVPWMTSAWAHRVAVWAGKHNHGSDLDVRGRRGMTFWEIVQPLKRAGLPFEVCNVTRADNRLLPRPQDRAMSGRRRLGTLVVERGLGRVLAQVQVPSLALTPWIDHLCLAKPVD